MLIFFFFHLTFKVLKIIFGLYFYLIHFLFFSLEANVYQVKSIFQAACYLKMDRIAKELARFMLKYLNVDNCIEIRSLPCISTSISFINQVNSFISAHVSLLLIKKTLELLLYLT